MIENKILLWNNFETTYSIVKKQGAKPIIHFVPPPPPGQQQKKKKTQTKWACTSVIWMNERTKTQKLLSLTE